MKILRWGLEFQGGTGDGFLAVAIFISYGIRGKAYEYLKKELIETAYGVKGLVKRKSRIMKVLSTRGIILGICFLHSGGYSSFDRNCDGTTGVYDYR